MRTPLRRAATLLAAAALAALAGATSASAAGPGALDRTFNGTGFELQDFFGTQNTDDGYAVVRQADGKIVVAGRSGTGGFAPTIMVARFNPDGSFDRSFGPPPGGFVHQQVCGASTCGSASAYAVGLDGTKIVVAGAAVNNKYSFVMRLNSDGSLDSTFDASPATPNSARGVFVWQPSGISTSTALALAVQSDHGVFVAGSAGTPPEPFYSRVKPDGSGLDYDHSLGSPGALHAAGIEAGQPVFAGWVGLNENVLVGRVTASGGLDTTFDGTGTAVKDIAGANDVGNALVAEPSGRLVVVGSATVGGKMLPLELAYTSSGGLDTSFAPPNGFRTIPPGGGLTGQFLGVAQAPGGKLAMLGDYGSSPHVLAARTSASGVPDAGFGAGGVVRLALADSDSAAADVVQPNGRIVFAGHGVAAGRSDDDMLVGRLKGFADPTCTATPVSSRVTRRGVVRLAIRCDQAVTATVRGLATTKSKHDELDRFPLGPLTQPAAAGARVVVSLKLPKDARYDLAHHAKATATFSLVATNANGFATAQATVAKLKPPKKRRT